LHRDRQHLREWHGRIGKDDSCLCSERAGDIIATNYREAGSERFILAGVLEHEAEIGRYREALGSDGMFICRLTVAPDVVKRRLARRHERDQMGLIWHRDRAVELARILATNTFDDIVLDSSDVEPSRLASALRLAAGWS
jgi:hypothetical protein